MNWTAKQVLTSYNDWAGPENADIYVRDDDPNAEVATKVARYLNLYENYPNTFSKVEVAKIFDAACVLLNAPDDVVADHQ
jgi:hypothetical protein